MKEKYDKISLEFFFIYFFYLLFFFLLFVIGATAAETEKIVIDELVFFAACRNE